MSLLDQAIHAEIENKNAMLKDSLAPNWIDKFEQVRL